MKKREKEKINDYACYFAIRWGGCIYYRRTMGRLTQTKNKRNEVKNQMVSSVPL